MRNEARCADLVPFETANLQPAATEGEQPAATKKGALPRGIRTYQRPDRPDAPFAVQWRVDGKRKTKAFKTVEAQQTFARSLAGDVKQLGVAAYRLNEDEAREWRAFRAEIGEASLADVARHWIATGKTRESPEVAAAVKSYVATKTAQGLSPGFLSHLEHWLERFSDAFAGRKLASIQRTEVAEWLATLPLAPATKAGHLERVREFYAWHMRTGVIDANPCAGIAPPKLVAKEVELYTVEQGRALFSKNKRQPRELLGRLALEAFAGLRFASASKIAPEDIKSKERGILLPAAKIKTGKREYIDGLPDNLWAWLEWAKPAKWVMTPRAYLAAKSAARIRADLPEVHNALRHSFCSYHIAAHKDASRTSVLLCHTSPAMLWRHYRGNATQADGFAWFQIMPPEL